MEFDTNFFETLNGTPNQTLTLTFTSELQQLREENARLSGELVAAQEQFTDLSEELTLASEECALLRESLETMCDREAKALTLVDLLVRKVCDGS